MAVLSMLTLASAAAEEHGAAGKAAERTPPVPQVSPATEQQAAGRGPDWTVSCFSAGRSAPLDCRIEQRLFARQTGRIVSVATIDIPGATRRPVLVLHLPTGLALQVDASISIDGAAATPLRWQSCDAGGCYAALPLSPALIHAMQAGKVMTVTARLANGQRLAFEHPLTDFAHAYEAAK